MVTTSYQQGGGDFFFGHGPPPVSNGQQMTQVRVEQNHSNENHEGDDGRSYTLPRDALEAAELQDCRQHLRLLAERIAELEQLNIDLESRLEEQANQYVKLESEATEIQRRWKEAYDTLERENTQWRESNSQLEFKNQRTREQLLRTERELHGIIQKKYQIIETARQEERERLLNANNGTTQHQRATNTSTNQSQSRQASQHDPAGHLRDSQVYTFPRNQNPHSAAPEEVRRGRAILALSDFFGIPNRATSNTTPSNDFYASSTATPPSTYIY